MIPTCEICNEKVTLDSHHIQSICYNGSSEKWNKCNICPNCHRKVHTGLIIIEGWFATSLSKKLVYRNKGEESISNVEDPKVWLYGNSEEL